MNLIRLVMILVVVGVLLWLVNTFNTYIPMDPKIKQILNIAVVIAVVIAVAISIAVIL